MAYKILVAVPAFGQIVTATTFLTTHNLMQAFFTKGIGGGITTLSFPDIAELRSMFLTMWYDTMPDSTHLLFIDSDMGFMPDLVLDMLLFDEPVVGTIYRQRRPEVSWAGSGTGTTMTELHAKFMKVEGVGMGCTLIRRDAVKAMIEKFPELVDMRLELHPAKETMYAAGAKRLIRLFEKMDLKERGVVSEDLSFCLRWGQCGGTVWASVGHRISHVGPYDYQGCYLEHVAQVQAAQQQLAASTPPAITVPQIEAVSSPPVPVPEIPALPVQAATDTAEPIQVAAE